MKLLSLLLAYGVLVFGQTVEFVADPSPTPSSHASTVVELANGDLLAAWFGGTAEGAQDVAIWMSRRTSVGWSHPVVAAREPNIATYNPVLFHADDGVLWLYYRFGPHPDNWSAARKFSPDEGATWSAVEHLPAGLYGPIRTKPLVLANGTILSGTSVESYGAWAGWIERSTDHGRTWTRHGPLAAPATLATDPPKPGEAYGIIQPSVVDLGSHHVRLYARSTQQIGRICQADSLDDGMTWSEVKATGLPNSDSGLDAVRLKDGRLVMVYNNTTSGRTPLSLAVSADGQTWKMFHELENTPGEYSYPALIQARSGDLLLTYTWRREKIRFVRYPLSKIP